MRAIYFVYFIHQCTEYQALSRHSITFFIEKRVKDIHCTKCGKNSVVLRKYHTKSLHGTASRLKDVKTWMVTDTAKDSILPELCIYYKKSNQSYRFSLNRIVFRTMVATILKSRGISSVSFFNSGHHPLREVLTN